MEYKKYIIFDCGNDASLYLNILNRNLKISELIGEDQTWDKPKLVGTGVGPVSKRMWIYTPKEEWLKMSLSSKIQETTDQNPDTILEDIYKIYQFINEDTDLKIHNYLTPPKSLDYKRDVLIRFAKEKTFDKVGNLVKVVYYENEIVTVNPIGIKTTVYENKILEATFEYTYESDGYLNFRTSTRKWAKISGELGSEISKNKYYDINEAKHAGERRRKNIQNIMENKVGTALFLTKGPAMVGGDGTLNTVAEADNLGKPLLNTLAWSFDKFVTNNEFDGILNDILNIDTEIYDWVLGIDPITGKTIQQLAHDIINDSII